jgi:putative spermidine/putrescine transport system substrate-binding protein
MTQSRYIKQAIVGTSFAAAALLAAGVASAEQLTVTSWGGALQDAQRKTFFEPFAKETGIKMQEDQWSGELAKLRAMVDAKAVTWNVVDVDPQTAGQACAQGLAERLDYSKLVDKSALVEGAAMECAVGTSTYASVLAYDPKKLKETPTSLSDLFDLKRFPGKRALHKTAGDNLEAALMADGVAPQDVYKVLSTREGQDRAFKKLSTIKKDVVWWEAGAQPAQMLASGQVVMAMAWNGRIADANKEGANLAIAWGNQIQGFDMWIIPTGAKDQDATYKFIKYTLDPAVNSKLPQHISYGPTVIAGLPMVDKALLANLPTAPENSTSKLVIDPDFWADYGPDLSARFSTWLTQ